MLDQKQLPDLLEGGLKNSKDFWIVGIMLLLYVYFFILYSFNSLKCFILPVPHMFIRYDLSVHVFATITW